MADQKQVTWAANGMCTLNFAGAEAWLGGEKWEAGTYRFQVKRYGYTTSRNGRQQLAIELECLAGPAEHPEKDAKGRTFTVYQDIAQQDGLNYAFGMVTRIEPQIVHTAINGQLNFDAITGGAQFPGTIFDGRLREEAYSDPQTGEQKTATKLVSGSITPRQQSPALQQILQARGAQMGAQQPQQPPMGGNGMAQQGQQTAATNPPQQAGLPTM